MIKDVKDAPAVFELALSNGKSITTTDANELYWFNETRGRAIVPPKGGGKRQRKKPQQPEIEE